MKNRLSTIKRGRKRKPKSLGKPDSYLDPMLIELINLHASQICRHADGIERHALDLKAGGETEQRLNQLNEWRKSTLFSEDECAALALCEAIVLHPTAPLARALLHKELIYFSEEQIMSLTQAILALIDWNPLSASCLLEDETKGTRTILHRTE
jgi:AhpD family alkylhydroperoxidase